MSELAVNKIQFNFNNSIKNSDKKENNNVNCRVVCRLVNIKHAVVYSLHTSQH